MVANFEANGNTSSGITSKISNLECSGCGQIFSSNEIHTFCPDCQSPLLARYDLAAIRSQVDRDAIRRRADRLAEAGVDT